MQKPMSLNEIFPGWNLNDRTLVWLWLVLRDAGMPLRVETYGTNDMRDRMANFIEDKQMQDDLNEAKTVIMLPEHDLQWIEKRGRQISWLLQELVLFLRRNKLPAPTCPAHLSPRDELIARIDYWRDPILEKQRLLDRLRRDWNRHIADDKHYDWFKRGNEKQKCEMAWNWYQEQHPRYVQSASKFIKLDDILRCHDASDLKLDEKRFHIDEIKKALKRSQSRSNLVGKAQTNLALSEEVRSWLNILAAKQGSTLVAVVERLIGHAHQHGMPKASSVFDSEGSTLNNNAIASPHGNGLTDPS